MATWICSLEGETEAQLTYPADLTAASEVDLLEWLELVIAILKQRQARRVTALAPVPARTPPDQEP